MTGIIFTDGKFQGIGNDGKVVALGTLKFTYSETGLDAITYKDTALTIANTNPVNLTTSGKADVYIGDGLYDVVLKDSLGGIIWSIEDYKYKNLEAELSLKLNINDGIKKIDTLADLRIIEEAFPQIWVSGYHTKNDGAFGSNIFRLKGIKTTEVDNGGTIVIATIDMVDYVYELQYRGSVDVKWFGATNEVDASIVFNEVSASFKNIKIAGSYILNNAVEIKDNQTWNFEQCVITHTDDSKTMFRAIGKQGFSLLGSLNLRGLLTTASQAAETGLHIDGCNNYTIDNLIVESFKGAGVSISGSTPQPITFRGEKGKFSNLVTRGNTLGINIDAGSSNEFTTFINTNASFNGIGVKIAAGNTTFVGGNIVDNIGDGVSLVGGANHGHGIISAMNIDHNSGFSVRAENMINGFVFNGCNIYGNAVGLGGDIFLDNSKGVKFEGGVIEVTNIYNYELEGQSGYNYITNVHSAGIYEMNLKDDTGNAIPKKLIVRGITGGALNTNNGFSVNQVSDVYVNATAVIGVAFPSATLTNIIFPLVAINGDARRVYNKNTGIFTVPSGMEGFYKISASAEFSGATISTPTSYIAIYKNNGAEAVSSVVQSIAAGKAESDVEQDIYLVAGDTIVIKAFVDGATAFSGSGFKSTLSINKIG